MASFLPMYLKSFTTTTLFLKNKIVVSLYNQSFEGTLSDGLTDKLKFDGYSEEELAGFEKVDYKKLAETAINYSDAVIKGSTELDEDLLKLIEDSKLPTLEYSDGEYKEQYKPFMGLFEEQTYMKHLRRTTALLAVAIFNACEKEWNELGSQLVVSDDLELFLLMIKKLKYLL